MTSHMFLLKAMPWPHLAPIHQLEIKQTHLGCQFGWQIALDANTCGNSKANTHDEEKNEHLKWEQTRAKSLPFLGWRQSFISLGFLGTFLRFCFTSWRCVEIYFPSESNLVFLLLTGQCRSFGETLAGLGEKNVGVINSGGWNSPRWKARWESLRKLGWKLLVNDTEILSWVFRFLESS